MLIGLLIAASNLASALSGSTPSGRMTGPAALLAVGWCALWALAAAFPAVTARCLSRWRVTSVTLACANALTVGVTGGMDSPVLSVCMYVGWIASVVLSARTAIVISLMITCSVFGGYLLAGASPSDVLASEYRDNALNGALLPILAGLVGVLLASVTNSIFGRLPEIVHGLRQGGEASTPGMSALFARRPVPLLPPATSKRDRMAGDGAPLTPFEREVVALLADGHRPKQIARMRGVQISTIRSHIHGAKSKTGARTIDELIAVAWDTGT